MSLNQKNSEAFKAGRLVIFADGVRVTDEKKVTAEMAAKIHEDWLTRTHTPNNETVPVFPAAQLEWWSDRAVTFKAIPAPIEFDAVVAKPEKPYQPEKSKAEKA